MNLLHKSVFARKQMFGVNISVSQLIIIDKSVDKLIIRSKNIACGRTSICKFFSWRRVFFFLDICFLNKSVRETSQSAPDFAASGKV